MTTSRDGYDKPFFGDNWFLNNAILGCFHRNTFQNCTLNFGKLIFVEIHKMLHLGKLQGKGDSQLYFQVGHKGLKRF